MMRHAELLKKFGKLLAPGRLAASGSFFVEMGHCPTRLEMNSHPYTLRFVEMGYWANTAGDEQPPLPPPLRAECNVLLDCTQFRS